MRGSALQKPPWQRVATPDVVDREPDTDEWLLGLHSCSLQVKGWVECISPALGGRLFWHRMIQKASAGVLTGDESRFGLLAPCSGRDVLAGEETRAKAETSSCHSALFPQ